MSALTPASSIPPTPNQCYVTPHHGVNTVPFNLKDPSVQLDETTLKVKVKSVVNEAIDEHPTIQRMGSEIGELKSDVAVLKTDVAVLKTDVAVLKTDVAELKTDVRELNSRFEVHARTTNYSINKLHDSVHKMSVDMEEIKSGLNKVIEIVMPSKIPRGAV